MPIQMGARLYLPGLGRFTQVDPILGGTANNYVYVLDPVNGSDYGGMFGLSDIFNAVRAIANTMSRVASVLNRYAGIVAARSPAATTAGQAQANIPIKLTAAKPQASPCDVFKIKQPSCAPRYAVGTPVKTYEDLSVGASIIYGHSVGKIMNDDGSTIYNYRSDGFAFKPGVGGSLTVGEGNPTAGCSIQFSAFAWLGGSISFPGPTVEFGAGTPGISIMRTCTY